MYRRGVKTLEEFPEFEDFIDTIMYLKPSYLVSFSHPDGQIGGPENGMN